MTDTGDVLDDAAQPAGAGEGRVPIFPETRIEADRVVLRPFGEADVEGNRLACSDELTQYWTSVPRPYTAEGSRDWCLLLSKEIRDTGEGVVFAIAERETDRYLGTIDLKKTDWQSRTAEVGYLCAPWARGHGYITESLRALAGWLLGEQGFERLELKAAPENRASQRVAQRCGFTREGVLRGAGIVATGRVDLILYSLLRREL